MKCYIRTCVEELEKNTKISESIDFIEERHWAYTTEGLVMLLLSFLEINRRQSTKRISYGLSGIETPSNEQRS